MDGVRVWWWGGVGQNITFMYTCIPTKCYATDVTLQMSSFALAHVLDVTLQMSSLALAHTHTLNATLQMFLLALAHLLHATLQMSLLALAHVLTLKMSSLAVAHVLDVTLQMSSLAFAHTHTHAHLMPKSKILSCVSSTARCGTTGFTDGANAYKAAAKLTKHTKKIKFFQVKHTQS